MNIELLKSLANNKNDKEPALRVGSATGAVAGIAALLLFFYSDSLTEEQIGAILVIVSALLPMGTSLITRGKVWSPATVSKVVDEVTGKTVK